MLCSNRAITLSSALFADQRCRICKSPTLHMRPEREDGALNVCVCVCVCVCVDQGQELAQENQENCQE